MEHLISIIIPVYNGEKYLPANIKSILGQTYPNLEIIYVDDGSTDGSSSILQSYSQSDSRIKLIRQENHGVSFTRNTGLAAATGDFVAFVDADDYIDPRYMEILLHELLTNQADIACCGCVLHRPDKQIPLHTSESSQVWDAAETMERLISGNLIEPGVWAKLFRAELVRNVRFDTAIKYNEDYLFNISAFAACKQAVFHGTPLYHYVLHDHSATTNAPILKRAKDFIYVAETAVQQPFSPKLTELLQQKMYISYLDYYNSLLYSKDADVLAFRRELRSKIMNSRKQYRSLGLSLRNRFFLYGICYLPGLYPWLYRSLKRLMPDRRTFKI